MIRRLCWLLLGAAAGIAGYRRLTAFAHAVSPVARAAGLARFTRDVREGMELYMRRHPPRAAPTLEGLRGDGLPGPAAGRARYQIDAKDGR